jgi:GNAT superfamily N-acetyltransferase
MGDSELIAIRATAAGEAQALRELRLRALAQAPEAFASDIAGETGREPAHWARLVAGGDDQTVLVAQHRDGGLVGMAGGYWFDRRRGIVQLWGLWVDPGLRGGGTGAALVAGVVEWAARLGARALRLGVIDPDGDGLGVTAFYRRLGFATVGAPAPMRSDPARLVSYMIRLL